MRDDREIDRLVAEKVMGWEYHEAVYTWGELFSPAKYVKEDGREVESFNLPYFSTNIADAWQVVEKIKKANFSARHRFITELQKEVTPKELKDKNQLLDLGWMLLFLTPKAICLAALKTAGVDVDSVSQ